MAEQALTLMRLFHQDVISSGYEESIASRLSYCVYTLLRGSSTLQTGADQDDKLDLVVGPGELDGMPLQHDERLLPYWKRFIGALSSVNFSNCAPINLSLLRVQLDKKVAEILLQSVKKAPLELLSLCNNSLGKYGYNWLVELLSTNTSLKTLYIKSNPMEFPQDVANLSKTVANHPKLDIILFENCGIGQSNSVMKSVVNVFCLREVSLENNDIDSYGATLISDCLITNPTLQTLYLRHNSLNNEDAKKLAFSLNSNTNLLVLNLSLNNITVEGMSSLSCSVCNITSLNSVSDSNHTCSIQFKEEEDVLNLRYVNRFLDPVFNKNAKLFGMLQRRKRILEDTPLQIIPKVLVLLHNVASDKLDAIFGFMKEWNMPLLYTSRLGKEPRRSKRIRKKTVMKYMGKK